MEIIDFNDAKIDNSAIALGKFEGLHRGHMLLINEVVRLGLKHGIKNVCFSINVSGRKTVNTFEERYSILKNAGVDCVCNCLFSEEFAALTPEQFCDILVRKLNPKFIVVGEDFRFGCKRSGNVDVLKHFGEKYGYEVVVFEKLKENGEIISTSLIKDYLQEGKVDIVNNFLGRRYSLSGTVVEGKKLGHKIGFPTINIMPDDNKLLPCIGVYYTSVILNGVSYKAITNVGTNPTVTDGNKLIIETHILNYDGNLYGETVEVLFNCFIRKQQKFENLDLLIKQLESDKAFAMHQ